MKRTRKVSIEIEQRKLTLSFALSGPHESEPRSDCTGSGIEPAPPVCPHCGAAWIAVTAYAAEVDTSGANTLQRLLQQHGLHLHVHPDGQLSLCSKSLERARFDEVKESL